MPVDGRERCDAREDALGGGTSGRHGGWFLDVVWVLMDGIVSLFDGEV